MYALLRQRNYLLLWSAGLISSLGDWVLAIALPFYMYARTGSALATGSMFIVEILPSLLFGSFVGVFVDRWDRRRTMIVADGLRAVLLLILFTVTTSRLLWIIYLFSFLETSISLFFRPAKAALLPNIITEEQRTQANALLQISDNAVRLAGPLLGGLLFAWLGLNGVIIADSLSYLLSGCLCFAIVISMTVCTPVQPKERPQMFSVLPVLWNEWIAGLRYIIRERWLLAIFIVHNVLILGQGVLNVLLIVFIIRILHGNTQIIGVIFSAQGIGGLLGGFVIGKVGNKFAPGRTLAYSLLCSGMLLLCTVVQSNLLITGILFALIGVAITGVMISLATFMQRVDDAYRGRVFATFGTSSALLMLISMSISSFMAQLIGVVPLLNGAALLFVLSGVLALVLLWQDGKDTEDKIQSANDMV